MNGKENIIIVKSDPQFEWERVSPRRRRGGRQVLSKVLAAVLVLGLGFSGAVGGMYVYNEVIADDTLAGDAVLLQQKPSASQTSKPADADKPNTSAPGKSDTSDFNTQTPAVGTLPDIQVGTAQPGGTNTASSVYEIVSRSTVLFTCEIVTQTSSGTLGDQFGSQFGGFGGSSQQPATSKAISYGSGVIMSADGYIMTNAHVVEDATKVIITLFDGREFEAKVIGADSHTDIAVVKIEATNLPAATFADSSAVAIGDDIYVVGNPLYTELAFSLTCGNVSSVNREIAIDNTLMSLMQVDAAVNPGNSGGPVANSQGMIVGIINSKIVDEDVEGIGFAVPSSTALSIATELIRYGKVASRPMLGISVESIRYEYAVIYKDQAGITVTDVQAGSCAEKAGLQAGDKITHFNGVEVWCNAQLNFQKEKYKIGDTVTMTIERNGQSIELTVVLEGEN